MLAQQPIPGELQAEADACQSSVATCVARMSEGYWHFVSFIPENDFLFLNTVKIEEGGRDEHGCDFNMPVMSGNVCLA